MKKLAPSILSCDFSRLGDEVKALEKAGVDMLHVDVMDGMFVPNISIGVPVVQSLRKVTKLPLDVHLMVHEPLRYVEAFAAAGADIITVHVEACTHLDRTLKAIKAAGKQAGVALNPATPLFFLDHIYDIADLILLMTVNPGFGGQSFIEGMLQKLQVLSKKLERQKHIPIEVDGGVGPDNIEKIAKAGAEVFVAGAAIFSQNAGTPAAPDYTKIVRDLKGKLKQASA